MPGQSFSCKGFKNAELTSCISNILVTQERILHVVHNYKKNMTEEEKERRPFASKYEQLKLRLISILLFIIVSFTNPFLQNPAYAVTSFDDNFSISSKKYEDPRKAKARKELVDLKNLQDSRLDICADKGRNWEQCFMYGESPTIQEAELKVFWKRGNYGIFSKGDATTKSRLNSPPTW